MAETIPPSDPASTVTVVDGVRHETRHLAGNRDLAPLVFLHEGLGSVSLWRQRGRDWPAEVCSATGRAGWVYARRGYGESDPIPDVRGAGRHPPDYMHRHAFAVLPRLLDAWGCERPPVLVGHSDGATIALLYASRYPVTACIALAPHVYVEPVAIDAIAAAKVAYETGDLRTRLARHHRDVDNAFWQWNDVWLSDGFRSFDIRSDCRQITAPLLLMQGEQDEYGTLAQLDAIQDAAPHAQRCVLSPCGHSPHRDQPDASLDAIRAFLAACG